MGTYDIAETNGKTLEDLGVWAQDSLEEWYHKFLSKYDIVGLLVDSKDAVSISENKNTQSIVKALVRKV